MDRRPGTLKDKKYKEYSSSPCPENCSNRPELGCALLSLNQYRDFSKYIPQEEKPGSISNSGQVEELYFNWLAKKKSDSFWYVKFLLVKMKFQPAFEEILEDQRICLQYPPNFPTMIAFGALDKGHIVRYKNPWDFHVILEHQPLYWDEGHHEKSETWKKYFPENNMSFDNGVDLFRGLTVLLSQYMELCHKDLKQLKVDQDANDGKGEEKTKPSGYKKGDLLICVVPRKECHEMNQCIMLGYRAVVAQTDLRVMTSRGGQIVEGICMRLYFLDTGENRLVEQDSDFVAPLPEVFSIFRPLAIPCALHGISPVGLEWSTTACLEMKRMTISDPLASPLLIEFYTNSKAKEQLKATVQTDAAPISEEAKTEETTWPWETPTYFVELTANVEDYGGESPANVDENRSEIGLVQLDLLVEEGKRVNVSTEMIRKNLGLQWNLFPDRPEVYPHYFDLKLKSADEALDDFEYFEGQQLDPSRARRTKEKLERGNLLKIYTELYKKTPMKIKGDEKIRSQVNVAFILNGDLDSQVMTVKKEVDDVNVEVSEVDEDDDIDVGNNVLSTLFNLGLKKKQGKTK